MWWAGGGELHLPAASSTKDCVSRDGPGDRHRVANGSLSIGGKCHERVKEEDLRSRYCHRWATTTWEYSAPPRAALCSMRCRCAGADERAASVVPAAGCEKDLSFRGIVPLNNSSTVTTAAAGVSLATALCRRGARGVGGSTEREGNSNRNQAGVRFKSATENSMFVISRSQRLWGLDASQA